MTLGDLSSLSEVGVGINIALALFESVRTFFVSRFAPYLEKHRDIILTNIEEINSSKGSHKLVRKQLKEIVSNYTRRISLCLNICTRLAVIVAFGFIVFLLIIAFDSGREIEPYAGWLSGALLIAPLSLIVVTNFFFTAKSSLKIRRLSKQYEALGELMKSIDEEDIEPPDAQ